MFLYDYDIYFFFLYSYMESVTCVNFKRQRTLIFIKLFDLVFLLSHMQLFYNLQNNIIE